MLDAIKKILWATVDKLCANMDAAEYKHLVPGLIFVKYISDKSILDKRYARAQLPDGKLGELVDLVSTIGFRDNPSIARDVLGQVYEYFLGMFASAEGKCGGKFLPRPALLRRWSLCSVRTVVRCMTPVAGRLAYLCSLKSSLKHTGENWATSQFTGKKRTSPPGEWRR